jgi:hypothetical protein
MSDVILSTIISAAITLIGFLLASFRWRKDIKVKLASIHDEITGELVRQRIGPYSELFIRMEKMSSIHKETIIAHPEMVKNFSEIFQDAAYGLAGLLASYDTREFLVYARKECTSFANGEISVDEYEWLQKCFWAVHVSLRSDLGIMQPNWPNEIERFRKQMVLENEKGMKDKVYSVPHIY